MQRSILMIKKADKIKKQESQEKDPSTQKFVV